MEKQEAKKGAVKVAKKVVEKKAVVKKDKNSLSDKQEKALKLIQKGTTKDSFIHQMAIEPAGFGGLIGNMRKKGLLVEMDKDGKLSLSK